MYLVCDRYTLGIRLLGFSVVSVKRHESFQIPSTEEFRLCVPRKRSVLGDISFGGFDYVQDYITRILPHMLKQDSYHLVLLDQVALC